MTNQEDLSFTGGDANSSFYVSFQDVNTKVSFRKMNTAATPSASMRAAPTVNSNCLSTEHYTVGPFAAHNNQFLLLRAELSFLDPDGQTLRDWQTIRSANPNGFIIMTITIIPGLSWTTTATIHATTSSGNLNLNFKPLKWLKLNYRLGTKRSPIPLVKLDQPLLTIQTMPKVLLAVKP